MYIYTELWMLLCWNQRDWWFDW